MKLAFGIILTVCAICAAGTQTNETSGTFVATNEWQEIAEGQSIPQGLHVRINLTTGKKEAKLLEEESSVGESSMALVPGQETQDDATVTPGSNMKLGELKEALKGIPANEYQLDPEEVKKIKDQYRSYEQIKKEMKDANMEVQSDSEIMATLFNRFDVLHKGDHGPELAALFEDLLYLVHQIDNALDFIDHNGVEKIIWPSLNGTESVRRVQALKLLGTVAQNNPKAKVALFERNAGSVTLSVLSKATVAEEVSAGIYAFGAMIRKFPFAQKTLLNPHGYSVLFETWNKKIDLKTKVKLLNLLTDLLVDYESTLHSADPGEADIRDQYRVANLIDGLQRVEYCKHAGEFFHRHRAGFVTDVNLIDETVTALHRSGTLCNELWSECPLFRHTLLVLRNNLDTFLDSAPQEAADYGREVQQTIDAYVVELYGQPKDEL